MAELIKQIDAIITQLKELKDINDKQKSDINDLIKSQVPLNIEDEYYDNMKIINDNKIAIERLKSSNKKIQNSNDIIKDEMKKQELSATINYIKNYIKK